MHDRTAMILRHHRSHTHTPASRRQGMTLVEVVLAMFILLMIFGAALSSVVQVGATVAAAKSRTRAATIMNQRMEEMRAMTFTTLTKNLAASGFTAGTEANAGFAGPNGRTFSWTRTIDTAAADSSSDLVKVVVTVTWQQRNGPRSISAYSYFSKNGVLAAESSGAAS